MLRGLLIIALAACGSAPLHTAKLDGLDVAYTIRGHGPTCVVMPGGPGLSSEYLRSKELEADVRAVYVDPLGTGHSGRLAAGQQYSMARDVATLEAVRAQLGIAKWCVVGHSYGGFVALKYALEHPEHVSGLLLYSTSPRVDDEWTKKVGENTVWFKDEPWFAEATRSQQMEGAATSQLEFDRVIAGELPLYFAEWTRRHAEYEKKLALHFSFDVAKRRAAEETFDVRDKLASIHVPVVIVSGERDFLFGGEIATWLDSIAGSQRVPITKAGHFSHIEQPAQFGTAVGVLAAKLSRAAC